MTSKVMVSGKHALTVRIEEEMYKKMRIVAAEMNCSVNEMIVMFAVSETVRRLNVMRMKE